MNHVVIACNSAGSGGSVATVAVKHARELAKYYERVTLVSNTFPEQLPSNVDRGPVSSINFNFLRRFCHVPNEFAFVRSVRKYLKGLHKRSPIDMIICHSHALAALSAKPLKDRYGITFGLVTHGDIFDRPRGTYDSRLTAFYKAVTPLAYRNADLIIALSPYMAECAVKGGANPYSVHIIPNGIDPEDIGLNPKHVSSFSTSIPLNNPLRLLYVGDLSILKGIDILLSACNILKRRGVPFSLTIIGDGKMKVQLKSMVGRMGLSEEIHFLGKVQRHMLGGYYQAADLVCVPSLSDSLPTVVLESLVSGTPVIGSDVGGMPFMVQEGHNGLLVSPKNYEALADAMEGLYKNPEKLAQLKENARPSVLSRFSWTSIGKRIYELIEEKLAVRPPFVLGRSIIQRDGQ
jgi:glycosyltransferase involved in cell wall biosynthesis